jgi:hypothetical protein
MLAGAEAVEIVSCKHLPGQALEDQRKVKVFAPMRARAQVNVAPRRELITKLATALSEAGKLDESRLRRCWLRDQDWLTPVGRRCRWPAARQSIWRSWPAHRHRRLP